MEFHGFALYTTTDTKGVNSGNILLKFVVMEFGFAEIFLNWRFFSKLYQHVLPALYKNVNLKRGSSDGNMGKLNSTVL